MIESKPEIINVYSTSVAGAYDCVRLSDYEALQLECDKLVEALKQILGWRELRSGQEFPIDRIEDVARNALAAYHKQGCE